MGTRMGSGATLLIGRAVRDAGGFAMADPCGVLLVERGGFTLMFAPVADGGSWDWIAVLRDRRDGSVAWSRASRGLTYADSYLMAERALLMLAVHAARGDHAARGASRRDA